MKQSFITFISILLWTISYNTLASNTDAEDTEHMTNKTLVSTFFQNFSDGNIDEAFAYLSDDANWWVAGDLPFSGNKTKTEYLQVVGNIQSGFPDGLKLEITSMISEDNTVAAEVSSLGQHANGRTYANKYHFLITIKDDKMIEVKEYMDTLHLFKLIQP